MYLKTIECGNYSQIRSPFWANLKDNLYKLGERLKRCKAVVGTIGFDVATWGIQAFYDFSTHFVSEAFEKSTCYCMMQKLLG